MLVAGVLVLASAATSIVRTAGLDAVFRGLEDRFNVRAREAGLLLGERSFNLFAGKNKRDEYRLAASVAIRGQASETVATVDQLFNC